MTASSDRQGGNLRPPSPLLRTLSAIGGRLGLGLILLLALFLRFYNIAGQSLWGDEGTSVALALRDLPAITQGAALDIHPPLYYYLLHFWMMLLGSGEIAVRALSAVAGVALVGVTYLLGKRLFGVKVALLAAVFSALSPLQIQYSQETRMYLLATLFSAVSVYLLTKLPLVSQNLSTAKGDHKGSPLQSYAWPLTAWVLVSVAALYTHYFAATVLIAENLAVGLYVLTQFISRKSANRNAKSAICNLPSAICLWSLAQIAVLLLFLPWLTVMQQQWTNWPAISEAYSLPELLARVLPAFSLGLAVEPADYLWAITLFGVAVLVGMVVSVSPRHPVSASSYLPLLYLFVPILTMYALSLRRPLYNAKFLLVATPAFYLLAALGLWRLSQWTEQLLTQMSVGSRHGLPNLLGRTRWGWRLPNEHPEQVRHSASLGPLVLLAIFCLPLLFAVIKPLDNYYHDPHYARDDYRGIVRTISLSAKGTDAIILNAPGQIDIFDYYYAGHPPSAIRQPQSDLPRYPLPRQRPLDEQDTAQQLQRIINTHGRIWAVLWGVAESDPGRFVESWLDAHAYKSMDRWFGNVRLALYAAPLGPVTMQRALNARLGEEIRLLGYSLGSDQTASGDILQVALFWQADRPITQRYKVFTHLLGPGDTLWGQRDSEPGGGLRLTTTWPPGETIQDNYGIPVLPGTPPGDYQIEIGMYRADTGQRLPIRDANGQPLGDLLLLGPVRVERPAVPPPVESLGLTHPLTLDLADLSLLGYDLIPPGSPDPPQVTLYWQAQNPGRDLSIHLRLADSGGRVLWERVAAPVQGTYPTTRWQPGEIVRDPYLLALGSPATGEYRLLLAVRDAQGQALPVNGDRRADAAGFVEIGRMGK